MTLNLNTLSSLFVKALFVIILLELFLLGSGQFISISGISLRMLFYTSAIMLSTILILQGIKTQRLVFLFLLIYISMLSFSSLLGILNGASISSILENIKPLIFAFMIIPFSLFIINLKRVYLVGKLIKISGLFMSVSLISLLIFLYFGYIELRIDNLNKNLSPKDVDINEIRSVISDIETFLYPTRDEKKLRPQISYDIESGSAIHKFYLPISAVILFNGLTSEISKRKSLDFLDYRRQEIIDKIQKKAIKEGFFIEFNSSLSNKPSLVIDYNTNYDMIAPQFYESEFYLYGEIYQEGGKNPNIHISTSKFGNLTISATKEQILDGEKKTYRPFGIKVRGRKNLSDGKFSDLKLIEFINYRPIFDKSLLEKVIERASVNLSKIKNLDSWIDGLKTDGI